LAKKIGVSQAQISMWKSNGDMSLDMQDKFKELLGIGELDPDFVYWTGGLENSKKWYKVIGDLADRAEYTCETGYITLPLQDEDDSRSMLAWSTIQILIDMGVTIPDSFPAEMEFEDSDDDSDPDLGLYLEQADENSICKIIEESYDALNNLVGFFTAYISPIRWADPDNDEQIDNIYEMEGELLRLAFALTGKEDDVRPEFNIFRYKTKKYWADRLVGLKEYAVKNQIPLKAELMDLISQDHDITGSSAERESLGFNVGQIHPDIYVNEILLSLRLINQVLPVICKKLGVEDHEYEFDETEFSTR